MKNRDMILKASNISITFLLLIVTLFGVCSFNLNNSYEIINQYGEVTKMYGSGIYQHDSYFKAPIFIGSDLAILIFIVPMLIISFIKIKKEKSIENYVQNLSLISLILYYSASIAFGVTYNNLHLIYIALFGISFYATIILFLKLFSMGISEKISCRYLVTKGMIVFLGIAGVSLFVAWLPDIISAIAQGTSLDLIEVYTTEITYVLDMGIMSPLIFITIYLISKRDFIGYVLLRMILKICIGIGIMLPMQSLFQIISGIEIPVPALITKILIFVLLAVFAVFYEHKLRRTTAEEVDER